MRTTSFATAVLLLACSLGLANRARAEDPPPPSPAKVLLGEIEAAKAAKDDAKWIEALKRITAVYPDVEDDAEKKALAQAAGQALKSKNDSIQNAGLEALVGTKDGEAAWKAGLKGQMPDEKAEKATAFAIKVVEALKDLHPEAAVPTLIGLLHNAKDPLVSARAATALSGYERSKQRVTILDELVKAIRSNMPGTGGRKASAPSARWIEMG
jgi:hypothetical protein